MDTIVSIILVVSIIGLAIELAGRNNGIQNPT